MFGKAAQQRLAEILEFHRTAIVQWIRECRKDGKLEPQARGHMGRGFSLEERERLAVLVKSRPDLALEEIRASLSKDRSLTAVHRELKRPDSRFKKNSEGVGTRARGHRRERKESL